MSKRPPPPALPRCPYHLGTYELRAFDAQPMRAAPYFAQFYFQGVLDMNEITVMLQDGYEDAWVKDAPIAEPYFTAVLHQIEMGLLHTTQRASQ